VIGFVLVTTGAGATGLFEARSRPPGGGAMDIVVREVERRPRASVIEVEINARGSSVGGSFFVMCSLRRLALERGNYHHIVKRDDQPRPGQMLVGFLRGATDEPSQAGPEFQGLGAANVLALDQFAQICAAAK
jgi:hypothetical protein